MSEEQTTESVTGRDSRTGLPDRDSFYRDVAPLLEAADANQQSLVLLDIDLDGIDFILRTFGPRERDRLIHHVGERIRDAIANGTIAYHITQGRFAVVLPRQTYRQATRRAKALVEALRRPFDVLGINYTIDAHVGISNFPNQAESLAELVRTSVFACHQARESGRDYATFDPELDEQERHRFQLLVDLDQALESQSGIRLAYQPQVDLASGDYVGVEGLCRWTHSILGPIPPGHFLPFVEQTSLMMPLTEATLGLGLEDLASWRTRGFEGTLSINLSPTLFRRPDLLERLLDHFRFSNMGMEALHFEVTETGIMDQPNQAVHTLAAIRERGSRISVDDFGTGRSSLAYLADLPIDTIKIDKYFIQHLSQPWGEAIVGAATTLANKLGLTTVAEGIERESEFEKCRELGVEVGQGFYVGRPMFRDDLEQWLGI